jgi:hypothetical protein
MTSPLIYLLDPVRWVREVLGHVPWEKQAEILEAVRDHKTTAVKSCHAAGKSFTAADVALWYLHNHPHSIVITTGPTQRQVEGILWREIRSSQQKAKVPLPGALLTTELKIEDGWQAFGFTAPEHDSDKFQGWHSQYILVVVDESSGVSEDIFDAIDGILTSDESRLLLIGNPTNPSGRFFKEFASGAAKITISAFDTPNFTRYGIIERDILNNEWQQKITGPLPAPYLVTPGWVHDRLKRWGRESPLYQAKVLAQFPQSGDDCMIPLYWIEAAIKRQLEPTDPSEIGVDVARYGADETVIIHRRGARARIVKVIPTCDTMECAGHVAKALVDTKATSAKIDAIGIGAGVYDRLKEQGLPVREMQSGAAAKERERFANTRAEWYWGLRDRFESGDIDIQDDETLISQLAGIRYHVNSKGQIQIEGKEDMKKRGLGSPDRADAMMLTFANVPVMNSKIRVKAWSRRDRD